MCHLDAWMRLSNILQSYALQLSFNPRGSFCCNHDCKSCLTTMLIKQTVLHHPPILVGLMHTCTNGMGCTLTKDSCAIHVNRLGAIFAHHKNPSGVFEEPDDLLDLILSPEWTYFWTKVILYSHCHNLFWDYNLHEKSKIWLRMKILLKSGSFKFDRAVIFMWWTLGDHEFTFVAIFGCREDFKVI